MCSIPLVKPPLRRCYIRAAYFLCPREVKLNSAYESLGIKLKRLVPGKK